jgi:hypothetical protein
MENLGKRTVLILVAVFLVLNLGWFICLQSMTDTVVRCTYGLPKLTCTKVSGWAAFAVLSCTFYGPPAREQAPYGTARQHDLSARGLCDPRY